MRHPEFPIVSFLCLLLLLCSLPSHIRASSVCTLALIAWLAVMSIIRGVNSIIWANNFVVQLEVWCDITTKITIGFTYAIPASALCILRHLERVASTRNAQTTKADKRRRQIFEAVMCFGIPLIFMALHYIVQGHRYDVIEDVGCVPFVYFSVAAVVIVWVPPFLMSLISFVYAGLSLRHFMRRRIEFAAHLQNSQSAITLGRYFRLMLLAVVEMIWDTGVNAYIIYFNTFTGLRPWISWENVHSNFSRVGLFPEFIIPPEFVTQLIWQWWIVPISCITFFIFFGFGEEAMSDYRTTFFWLRRNILRQNIPKPSHPSTHAVLPTHRCTRAQHFDLRLSATTPEQKFKPWDDVSLKIPEIIGRSSCSSYVSELTIPRDHRSLSPEHYSNLTSNIASEPPTSSQQTTHYSTNVICDMTLPVSEVYGDVASVDLSRTPTPPPALPHTISSLVAYPSSTFPNPGHSTMTDVEIDVSPAYISDLTIASRCHQETFSPMG